MHITPQAPPYARPLFDTSVHNHPNMYLFCLIVRKDLFREYKNIKNIFFYFLESCLFSIPNSTTYLTLEEYEGTEFEYKAIDIFF